MPLMRSPSYPFLSGALAPGDELNWPIDASAITPAVGALRSSPGLMEHLAEWVAAQTKRTGLLPALRQAPKDVEVPEAAVRGWWGASSRTPGLTNYERTLAEEYGVPPSEALAWWQRGGPRGDLTP